MAGATVGTGTTITLATATYPVDILSVSQGDETVPVIDTVHMGTTGSRIKTVGKLKDHGELTIEVHCDPSQLDLMKVALGTSQAVTVTFPGGATATGTGAITAHNYTVPLEDKLTAGYTVTWLGAVTYADPPP